MSPEFYTFLLSRSKDEQWYLKEHFTVMNLIICSWFVLCNIYKDCVTYDCTCCLFRQYCVSIASLLTHNVMCVSWNQKKAFVSKVWLAASGAIMNTFLCQRPNCFSFQMAVYPKAALLFAWLNNEPCNSIVKCTSYGYQYSLAYDSTQ